MGQGQRRRMGAESSTLAMTENKDTAKQAIQDDSGTPSTPQATDSFLQGLDKSAGWVKDREKLAGLGKKRED